MEEVSELCNNEVEKYVEPGDRPGEHGAARAGSATRNSAPKQ